MTVPVFRRTAALTLTASLAVAALWLGGTAASAADRPIDKLPFDKHAAFEFLGSVTFPAESGSLSDRLWLGDGAITTEQGCPTDTKRSRSKIVLADGTDTTPVVSNSRTSTTQAGWGLDGNPIRLSIADGINAVYAGGFQDQSYNPAPTMISAQDFWYVLTCDPAARVPGVDPVSSPYFSIKLHSDGTNWSVVKDAVGQEKTTSTVFTHLATQPDGRVKFVATVIAEGKAVSGGTVDFVNAADETVIIASGSVVAGQAMATSTVAVDATKGVSVRAVYRGTTGFTGSPSDAQQVYGVQPAQNSSETGDVTVVVEQREEPAPAGSVKFTAAATSVLGKAAFTAKGIEANGAIDGAVVTDTRINKSAAWVVNGRASDFTTAAAPVAGKLNTIPASALSWKPAKKTGTELPAGATEGTADQKLNADRALVSWAAGGTGPAETKSQVGASLKLAAEGDFVPGSYTAKLTLTLV